MAQPALKLATLGSDAVRDLAAELFNRVWTLLAEPNRSADGIDTMIHAAHASRCAEADDREALLSDLASIAV